MSNEKKDLEYYKQNANEDYIKTPISVLRYITELEEARKKTYYFMFGSKEATDAITDKEAGHIARLLNDLSGEYDLFKYEQGAEPFDMLSAFDGWSTYVVITEKEYNTLQSGEEPTAYTVVYFNAKGEEIDRTEIDEDNEVLAWDLFKEFGHTRQEGDMVEITEVN